MSTRNVKPLLALLLAVAGPSGAHGADVYGWLGLRYDRLDAWMPNSEQTTVPQLQLDANLSAAGYLSAPEVLQWSAGGGYQRVNRSYLSQDEINNAYTYRLHLGLFDSRTSIFTVTADAGHSNTDHSLDVGGATATGTTTDDVYQLRIGARALDRPGVWLSGLYRDATNRGFGRGPINENMKQVTAGFAHGTGPYSINAEYEGRQVGGTLAASNYDRHTVRVNGTVSVSETGQGFVSAQYVLLLPELLDPTSPRSEQNQLSTGYRWRQDGLIGTAQYSYNRLSLSAPGTAQRERISQGFSGIGERTVSPTWKAVLSIDLNLNQDRLDLAQETSAGQGLGALARWTRLSEPGASDLFVEAGPRLGLLEPVGGSTRLGYGASAHGRWSRTVYEYKLAANYVVDYGNNFRAIRGWTLTQQLSGEAERIINGDMRVRATLLANASRQDVSLFGAGAERNVALNGRLFWRRHELYAEAGLRDGVTASLDSIGGDGLFIPAKFQSHSRYAQAGAGIELMTRLRLDARARYTTLSGPQVPDQQEVSLGGGLHYSFGLFQLSLEDRYTAGGASNYDTRNNVLYVLLSRTLGGRF